MPEIFDTLLLLALPASGKSEVRNYLEAKNPEQFHLGNPTVQLDDYPYVHLQVRVDEELADMGLETLFHRQESEAQRNGPFRDKHELGGLIHLLNEDFQELLEGRADVPERAAKRLFERFDNTIVKAGGKAKIRHLPQDVQDKLAERLEAEAAKFFEEKAAALPATLEGRTVVIEFARGGADGAAMPITDGLGYAGSLPHLSEEILRQAAILYIWVTPEESRRKNRARARPDGAGSILFHGTPESVMMEEYGSCDMHYLIEQSDVPDTVQVEKNGKVFHVPVAAFDNRVDLTTFLRKPVEEWTEQEIGSIHNKLAEPCQRLWTSYVKQRG
jgi:hypothetical protein